MKEWKCSGCSKTILVSPDYKYEFCCSGHACSCRGHEVNPVFCDECHKELLEYKAEV